MGRKSQFTTQDRQAMADMRIAGATLQRIADTYGISLSQACRIMQSAPVKRYMGLVADDEVYVAEVIIRAKAAKAAQRMSELADDPDGYKAIQASRDILDRAGVGKQQEQGGVTVVFGADIGVGEPDDDGQ